ncbi:MAG: hypothetical protein IBJ03_04975 [Gemmatimonadaceae bacterium]|nr:hypothetical protein [Gemmatimonadaceae bacterium]
MSRWAALDSAAKDMLRWAPNDSALVMAGPLATYHLAGSNVSRLPEAEAAFQNASRYLPRVDSARFYDFDGILTRDDDEWRYGFLPNDRLDIDRRGWLVIDPMWSTPVNEVQLARMARMAEADYRYAQHARPGQSGSETPSGRVHMRRGAPSARWERIYPGRFDNFRYFRRTWDGLTQDMQVEDLAEWWRAFAGGRQRAALLGFWTVKQRSCLDPRFLNAAYRCVEQERASWKGVPFVGTMDTIDVMLARFRGGLDSMDLHVEARVPLRSFPHQKSANVQANARIATTLFLRQPMGEPIATLSTSDPLPPKDRIAFVQQWQTRAGPEEVMHRVEAYEPLSASAARGIMHFNSDAAIRINVRGFGMSDVLITGHAVEQVRPAVRWNDFVFTPNAGVVLPKERFSVLWEIYDLTPGPDGRIRWSVNMRRETGEIVNNVDMRDALTTARKASAKVLADEPDASSLSYTREAHAKPVVVEHIKLPLQGNAPYGRHVVSVTVTDLVSGKRITRSTGVRLLVPSLQRRLDPIVPVLPFR